MTATQENLTKPQGDANAGDLTKEALKHLLEEDRRSMEPVLEALGFTKKVDEIIDDYTHPDEM